MVNNYDRIYRELCQEAERVADGHQYTADLVVTIAMEIVNLVDEHRIRPTRIKKAIDECITKASLNVRPFEEE